MALNSVIGALRVNLGLNSASFIKGLSASDKELKAFQKRVNRIGQGFQSIGTRLSVGLTLPLTGLAAKSLDAAKKQEAAVAQVDAALKSMGQTAGFTSEQLQAIAAELQGNSLFGDEEILDKVTANLLTFGNVAGEQFTRAQQLALDLSARLDQDLKSSAIQLGKALNDPVEGLSALSRVGIQFSEEQEELIKSLAETGRVAEAQALILDELEKQYAGQAQAVAALDSGRIAQSYNRIGDALERVGAVILPVVADILEGIAKLADSFSNLSPQTQKFIVIAGGLAAAIGPIAVSVGLAVSGFSAFLPLIVALVSPVGLAVTAVAGLAAVAVTLYKNWDEVVAQISELGGILKKGAQDAVDSFIAFFKDIIKRAGQVIDDLKETIKEGVKGIGSDMLQAGKDIAAGVGDGISAGAGKVADAARGLGEKTKDGFKRVLEIFSPSRVFRGYGENITEGLVEGIDSGSASAVSRAEKLGRDVGTAANKGLSDTVQSLASVLGGGGGSISSVFDDLKRSAGSAFGDLFGSGFSSGGFSGAISNVTGAFSGLSNAVGGLFSGSGGLRAAFGAALPVVGALTAGFSVLKSLFGSTKVIGQGFEFGVEGGQATGGQFTTTERKRLFGLSKSVRTSVEAFDTELAAALNQQLSGIREGVSTVFEGLGVEVSEGVLNGVTVAAGRFDTRGLTEQEVEQKFTEVFASYTDAVSNALGGISFESASFLLAVQSQLQPAGQMLFGTLGDMAVAAEDLAGRFGGLQGLGSSVSFFFDRFFTETEKLDTLTANVETAFGQIGLEVPKTISAFKELALSQNLMTEAGREAYAALLQIAPQFEAITASASNFGAFQTSQKNFETEIEERIAQVALARGLGLGETERLLSGTYAGGSESPLGLLQQMAETLDRMEVLGIPERN